MLTILSNLIGAALVSVATLTNPTNPKGLTFDASAYVTAKNQIRLAVVKPDAQRLTILLRNKQNDILFRQVMPKKENKTAILFTMSDLADGQYEIEIQSTEGSIRKQVTLSTTPQQQPVRVIAMQTN